MLSVKLDEWHAKVTSGKKHPAPDDQSFALRGLIPFRPRPVVHVRHRKNTLSEAGNVVEAVLSLTHKEIRSMRMQPSAVKRMECWRKNETLWYLDSIQTCILFSRVLRCSHPTLAELLFKQCQRHRQIFSSVLTELSHAPVVSWCSVVLKLDSDCFKGAISGVFGFTIKATFSPVTSAESCFVHMVLFNYMHAVNNQTEISQTSKKTKQNMVGQQKKRKKSGFPGLWKMRTMEAASFSSSHGNVSCLCDVTA